MSPSAQDLADKHRYLASARPEWSRSLAQIVARGGPWPCEACNSASLLSYRCSICGHDLASTEGTHGRQA